MNDELKLERQLGGATGTIRYIQAKEKRNIQSKKLS